MEWLLVLVFVVYKSISISSQDTYISNLSQICSCFGVDDPASSRTGYCRSETDNDAFEASGILIWPKTEVGSTVVIKCPHNKESNAMRSCLRSNLVDSGGIWGPILDEECHSYKDVRSKNLSLLAQREVNVSNVVKTAKDVKNLSFLNKSRSLYAKDMNNIASVLEKIVAVERKQNEISDDFLTAVDNVLDAEITDVLESQQEFNSSSRIVTSLNNFIEALVVNSSGEFERVKRNYAVNSQEVSPQTFNGSTFIGIQETSQNLPLGESSFSTVSNDNVPRHSFSSISIPRNVFSKSNISHSSSRQKLIFVYYKETKFFRVSLSDTQTASRRLNSFVIAGSIKGLQVENLTYPVKIAFQSITPGDTDTALCSYWDFVAGNWSQEGCTFERVLSNDRILCSCNHLTNFAMLMDVNPEVSTKHENILSVISYVGCAISFVALILTIITFLLLRLYRNNVPNQILLNFCTALSFMLIVFLVAPEAKSSKMSTSVWCRTSAVAMHYFLLAAFFWMAVEAFNMYRAFVKVFPAGSSSSKIMLNYCFFAWGTPAVIVAITMAVALDSYGDKHICRLLGIPFFVAFLAPSIIIVAGNLLAFCLIIRSLLFSASHVTTNRKVSGFQRARQGITIMVLLGLTWIFGILAIGDAKLAFQLLFCIFNTLQGSFVFFFNCILNTEIRQRWQRWLQKRKEVATLDIPLQQNTRSNTLLN